MSDVHRSPELAAEQLRECRARLRQVLDEDPLSFDLHRRREWFARIIGDTQNATNFLPDNERKQRIERLASDLQVQVSAMVGSRAQDEVAWGHLFSNGRDLVRLALEDEPREPPSDPVAREEAA